MLIQFFSTEIKKCIHTLASLSAVVVYDVYDSSKVSHFCNCAFQNLHCTKIRKLSPVRNSREDHHVLAPQ